MGHYHSVSSAIFARITNQRLVAERARHAGRQIAHDNAASARAAEKRAKKRHEIATRPRGKTEIVGRHEDGRPIYRAIPAFRARGYTPPDQRKERPEPAIEAVNGWRYNVQSTSARIAAALKAEAPQPSPLRYRVGTAAYNGESDVAAALDEKEDHRIAQRAARKLRAARIRRRGW